MSLPKDMTRWLVSLCALMIVGLSCIQEQRGTEEEPDSLLDSIYDRETVGAEPTHDDEHLKIRFEINDPCRIPFGPREHGYFDGFLYWSPNGEELFWGDESAIVAVNIMSHSLRHLVDTNPSGSKLGVHGLFADLSPDGTRIAYSSCEFTKRAPNYELVVLDIHGGDLTRLTVDGKGELDHYPSWAPNGSRIMYIHSKAPGISNDYRGRIIHRVIDPKSRQTWDLVLPRVYGTLSPAIWSPDAKRVALITLSSLDQAQRQDVLVTVRTDGTDFQTLGTSTTLPVWTPDAKEVIYAGLEGGAAVVYAVQPNGEGNRVLWRGQAQDPPSPVTHLHLSPEGSELLVVADGIAVLDMEGSGYRKIVTSRLGKSALAKWSPDGSKIAVHQQSYTNLDRTSLDNAHLFTIAPDGSDLQLVAWKNDISSSLALSAPLEPDWKPEDTTMCSTGLVVLDPLGNPDLVRDCEVLLEVRNALMGSTVVGEGDEDKVQPNPLIWDPENPIDRWEGITVGCSPPRVIGVVLPERGLAGTVPAALGQLTALRGIDLGNLEDPPLSELPNRLTGTVPKELTDLPHLRVLILRNNYLSGPIPAEIWMLQSLVTREFEGNNFLDAQADRTTDAFGLAANEIQCE